MNICWIGKKLRALRERHKMTQEKLGREVALSASAISNIENSLSFPSVDTLIKLAEYFHVDIDYFINNNEKNDDLENLAIKAKLKTTEEFLRSGKYAKHQFTKQGKRYRLEESEDCLLYEVKTI